MRAWAFVILLALVAGCARPAPAEDRSMMAFLEAHATYASGWNASALERTFGELGYPPVFLNETAIVTQKMPNTSLAAERVDASTWKLRVDRVHWRVVACDEAELDAWTDAALAELERDAADLRARLEQALALPAAQLGEARAFVRNSDATTPPSFFSCGERDDGVVAVPIE